MTYKITHVDHHRRRRQVVLQCDRRATAEAIAQLMYGTPMYLCAVRLKPASSGAGRAA